MDKEPSVGCDNVEIFKDFSTFSGYEGGVFVLFCFIFLTTPMVTM